MNLQENINRIREMMGLVTEETNQYKVEWELPTDEYISQELDEFFRVIRFSKKTGGYLHPSNLDIMLNVIPKTLEKFAELVYDKANHLLPKNFNSTSTKDILTNIKEDKLKVTDKGSFSQTLMDLMPICEELKKDSECRTEGIELLKNGVVVDWTKDKIKKTSHMGKLSDFPEYDIKNTEDPKHLLTQIKNKIEKDGSDKTTSEKTAMSNLQGFLYNIKNFTNEGEKKLPMPFVFHFPSGDENGKIYSLFGGHKRSSVALQLGIPIKVWLIDLTK